MQDNKKDSTNLQKQAPVSNKQSNLNSMPKQITVNYISKNQQYLWRRIKHEFVQSVTTHCNKHQLGSRDDIEDFIYKYMKQLIGWLQNRDEGKTSNQIVKFKNQIKDLKKIVKQSQERVRRRQEKKIRSMQEVFVFVYQMLSRQHKQTIDLRRRLKDEKKRIEESQQYQKIIQTKMVGKLFEIAKHKFNQTLLIQILNKIASQLSSSKNRQQNLIKIAIGLLQQEQNKGRAYSQILQRIAIKSKQCSILRDTIADLQDRYIKKCQQRCQSCQEKEVTIAKFEQQLETIAKQNYEMSKLIAQKQSCQEKIAIQMQEQIAIQKELNGNLRKQMRDLSYCLYQLTEKYRSRHLQLVEMSKQYEQALEISQSYQIQMVKMQSNLVGLQNQTQALHQENTKIKAQIKSHQKSLISLINNCSGKGKILEDSIENKILQLKSIIDNLNSEINVYKNQIKEIKQKDMGSQIQLQNLREKQENHQLNQTKPISCWSRTESTAKQTGLEDKHIFQVEKFYIEKALQMKQRQVQTDQTDLFFLDQDKSSSSSEYAQQCDRGTQYETRYLLAFSKHDKEIQTHQMKVLEKISQTQESFSFFQKNIWQQKKLSQKICELQEQIRQMESENIYLIEQNKDLTQLACSSADELNLVKKSEGLIRKMLQTSRIEHAGTKFQLQQLRHHFNSQFLVENSLAETKDKEAMRQLEMSLSELKEQNEQLKKHNVQLLDTIQYANSLFNSSNHISQHKILASEKEDKKINLIGYCKSENMSSPLFEIETSENSQKSQQQSILINNSKNNLKCQESADIQTVGSYGQAISRLLADFISQQSSQQTKISAFSTLVSLVNPNKDQSEIFEAFLKIKRLRYKSVEKLDSKQEISKCLDQPGIKDKLFKFLTSN